jgi:hypothetical protein
VVGRIEPLDDAFLAPEMRIGFAKLADDFIKPHELEVRPQALAAKLHPR